LRHFAADCVAAPRGVYDPSGALVTAKEMLLLLAHIERRREDNHAAAKDGPRHQHEEDGQDVSYPKIAFVLKPCHPIALSGFTFSLPEKWLSRLYVRNSNNCGVGFSP